MVTVLKFSATWCEPCKILSHLLGKKENLQEVDIVTNPELVMKYNVRNVPTLVFLKNDKEVHRTVGIIKTEDYDKLVEEIAFAKELNEVDAKFETGEE
jgi:thioredoxin 1